MSEEEKILAGQLFSPNVPELAAIKNRSHRLSREYAQVDESDMKARREKLLEILGALGEGSSMTPPIFFHYGKHTSIGERTFCNYNFTVQDDAPVTIGNDCNFGPNCTIVTPCHPLLPDERRWMLNEKGEKAHMCYALPVRIGNDCWFGANVVICPGVTIGDNCVIGAGSVVTSDIPANSVAVGVPCRVLRTLSEKDSMKYKPEILGDNRVIE